MSALVLVAILAAVIFNLSYLTKRRFGVMGLALLAGYVLTVLWASGTPMLAATIGLPSVGAFSAVTIVTLLILFLPVMLLFFGGPIYGNKRSRLIGSLLFTSLAVVFTLDILQGSLVLLGSDRVVFDLVAEHRTLILSVAIAFSIFDLMAIHTPNLLPGKDRKSA